MPKPIIALKTYSRDYDGLVILGSSVIKGMDANIFFNSPSPSVIDLEAAVSRVSACMAKWGPVGNRGSHADLLNLRQEAQELMLMLRSEAEYAQAMAQTIAGSDYVFMEFILATTGFPLRNKNKPQGKLEMVQNFQQVVTRTLNANEAKLEWEKPLNLNSRNNVKTYLFYKSNTPSFADAKLLGMRTQTNCTITNATGKVQTWYFCVAAFNYAGEGAISHLLKVRLLP